MLCFMHPFTLQEKQDNITVQACQEEVFYFELMEVKDFRCVLAGIPVARFQAMPELLSHKTA